MEFECYAHEKAPGPLGSNFYVPGWIRVEFTVKFLLLVRLRLGVQCPFFRLNNDS